MCEDENSVVSADEPGMINTARWGRTILIASGLLLFLLGAVGCVWLASWLYNMSYGDVSRAATTTASDGLATLPPPLAHVEFPELPTDYPADWPSEYRYPDTMPLVEAASGNIVGGDAYGWTAKHRFSGDPQEAADVLASWLQGNGWNVVERFSSDSGGFVLLVQRGEEGTGVITIDVDPSRLGASLIASTLLIP